MKPRWERIVNQISAENFYALTGCTDANVVRFILIKFLLNLFDEQSAHTKGFTQVSLCSGYYNMEVVYEGQIVDMEFYLQIIGAGMPSIWRIMFSTQNAEVAETFFAQMLEYLAKEINSCVNLSVSDISHVEKEFYAKMDAFLNLPKYQEYVAT